MADYKRIVSYIYNYEFNVKKNNVGYARLETAGKQCKITVHINVLSMNETELKVCFFLRGKNGPECIPLGRMIPKNGMGDFRIAVMSDNLMDTGYSLEEMGGMLIYSSDDKFFGTEWDDRPILLKRFVLAGEKVKEADLKAAELLEMEAETGEAPAEEEASLLSEPEAEEKEKEPAMEDNTPLKEEGVRERSEETDSGNETVRPGFEPERIMKIFRSYPKLYPFEDNEIQECVRIELQDIGVFPLECWDLANNSFLLHGYYSYRHLIFAKKLRDGREEYLVGVPGFYYNREKFMAGMFGFDQFKSIKNTDQTTGEFGYWMKSIS